MKIIILVLSFVYIYISFTQSIRGKIKNFNNRYFTLHAVVGDTLFFWIPSKQMPVEISTILCIKLTRFMPISGI